MLDSCILRHILTDIIGFACFKYILVYFNDIIIYFYYDPFFQSSDPIFYWLMFFNGAKSSQKV